MTEKETYEYEDVKLGYGDIMVAFGFYENACNSFGYAQEVESLEEIDENNVADVLGYATEAGFTLKASGQFRQFEQFLLKSGVNNGFPKVWTSYYSNFKKLKSYGVVPIRVARFAPRFTKKHPAYLKLAPSKEMLAEAKSGNYDPKAWRSQFEDILAELNPHEVYEELLELGEGRDVAILCYEKPGDRCHRHYVTDWLNEAGYEVNELPTKEYYGKPASPDACCSNEQVEIEFTEEELKDE